MTGRITCCEEFAETNGWDFTCIEDTARLGVSEVDVERLRETDVTPADLLGWCRKRLAYVATALIARARDDVAECEAALGDPHEDPELVASSLENARKKLRSLESDIAGGAQSVAEGP
jgi:phytoene/squalene synthetase